MKACVVGVIVICSLFASGAVAQRGGGVGGHFGAAGRRLGHSPDWGRGTLGSQWWSTPFWGRGTLGRQWWSTPFGYNGFAGYPGWDYTAYDYPGWDDPAYDPVQPSFNQSASQGQPAIVFAQAPEAPPPPPQPARPELHEYKWPASTSSPSATLLLAPKTKTLGAEWSDYKAPDSAPNATFLIALKNGTVRPAVAVCVQQDMITYIAPGGIAERVPLTRVDRTTTRHLNLKQGTPLWLPGDNRSGGTR